MKKSVKKYAPGGPTPGKVKTKIVAKSPDGNYKTIEKHKSGPQGVSDSIKTRRTIKGAVTGAPKPGQFSRDSFDSNPTPLDRYNPKEKLGNYKQKKGGAVKRKK